MFVYQQRRINQVDTQFWRAAVVASANFEAYGLDFCVVGKWKMFGRAPMVSSGNLWKEIVADRPRSLCMVSTMSLTCQISDTCSAQETRAHMVNLDAFCIPLFPASQNLSLRKETWKQKSDHMATLIKGVMLVFSTFKLNAVIVTSVLFAFLWCISAWKVCFPEQGDCESICNQTLGVSFHKKWCAFKISVQTVS